jgi:V/A-type H+/Na+-transporting ATPase subunit A
VSGPAVVRVSGPLVEIAGMGDARLEDLVEVGPDRLVGEVISLRGDVAVVQSHEHTGGLAPGAPATLGGGRLSADLGPGLLGGTFDGMLRRLGGPGGPAATLPGDRRWSFRPRVGVGDLVERGAVLGTVPETAAIELRVLAPPDVGGRVERISPEGEYTVGEPIAMVGGRAVRLAHRWPLRRARPSRARIDASVPLSTGQRALDLMFPVARGSTAAVPGGFGTGKTVLLQQIAKWCDADVIVYVSCGERGNELADVLHELSRLEDPRTGRALLDRTVLIANTSNMPLMARELSVYAGATVAEYYRDMGYDALVIADSTSRWAEALREIASRAGELPAEEGYPASLPPRLASFYERAGRVRTLGGDVGSVTILGAVSPPGGDMAEPVTAHTQRFVRAVWSLDRDLAYARHYPAVSWTASSSRDAALVARWHVAGGDPTWGETRGRAVGLLGEADRVEAVAGLVGVAALPDQQRVALLTGRLLREAVLQQSALSERDAWCAPVKQSALLRMVLDLHDRAGDLVRQGVPAARIEELDLSDAARARERGGPEDVASVTRVSDELLARLDALG